MFLNMLAPRYTVESVLNINLQELRRQGISGILLDFDNTLLAWSDKAVSNEVIQWVKKALQSGFQLCIVSNAEKSRLRAQANILGIPYVSKALKPGLSGIRRALKLMNLTRSEVTMVGDQMFTDVLAGNRAGLATILVKPIFLKEQWWMKYVRKLENFIQKRLAD